MCLKLRSFKDGFKKARRNAKDRNGKRYTQESFAESFGVSVDTVKNWEQGRTAPSIDTLIELCDFFECDIDYLFGTLDCKTHDVQFIQEYIEQKKKTIQQIYILNYTKEITDTLDEMLQKGLLDIAISIKEGRKNLSKFRDKKEETVRRSEYLQTNPDILENREELSRSAKEMGSYLASTKLNILNAQQRFYNIVQQMVPVED